MISILDASALLRFIDKIAGFERVPTCSSKPANGDIQLLLSAVNRGES
jgi:hypothetical protein